MNLISFCFMILMTSVTGSLVFGIWKICSFWPIAGRQSGRSVWGLTGCLIFFIFPLAYIYIVTVTGCFTDGTSSLLFLGTPFLVKCFKAFIFDLADRCHSKIDSAAEKQIGV